MDVTENENMEMSNAMDVDSEQGPTKEKQASNSAEIDLGSTSVMATGPVISPSISVSLHPLVVMNVSEHWTRIRAQEGPGSNPKIIGALIGKQKGRNAEIMNSFELNFEIIEKTVVINMDFYKTKELQFKQVFPEMEFLGWYTNGDLPNECDLKIHRQIIEIIETPLFLKLNPLTRHTGLPIKLYESIIDIVNDTPTMLFVNIPYTLATEEAERIGLDHMARMTSTTHNGEMVNSVVTEHLRVQYSAVKMLRDRIKLILEFIQDTKNNTIPVNHDILRDIFNLSHRLPINCSDGFNEDFYIQCNDVALISYLGTLTKCSNTINQYVNKFNIFLDRQGIGRRTRLF